MYKIYWMFWWLVDSLWLKPLCHVIHSHKWVVRITRLQAWAVNHSPSHRGFCCKTHFIFIGMTMLIGRAEMYESIID